MANWRKLFNEETYNRGIDYFQEGNILDLKIEPDGEHFNAQVKGNYKNYYDVSGRLRDGETASQLKCMCPWAQKGHRCKHEVAALIAVEMGFRPNPDEKISFIEQLPADLKEKIKNSNTDDDPLEIIGDRSYSREILNEANRLFNSLAVTWHSFQSLDFNDNKYLFDLAMAKGFLKFNFYITFTKHKIKNIEIDSQIRNFNTKTLEVVGLTYFIKYFLQENPTEATNISARRLLEAFQNREDDGLINIRAQITIGSYDRIPKLFFKIGQGGHLYKVQDLNNLVDMSRRCLPMKLGKFFDRTINPEQIDELSKKWYQFIVRLVDANAVFQSGYDNFYGSNFKEISLTNTMVDQVDEMLKNGAKIYDDKRIIKRVENDEKLPFSIKVINGKTIVEIGNPLRNVDYFTGSSNYYSYENGVWTKYLGMNPNTITRWSLEMGDQLEFGAKSLAKFGHDVLPALKETNNFEIIGEKSLEEILPPEAKIIYRLDYQNDELICDPRVHYGDKEYELNKPDNDKTVREWEKEKAGLALIEELGFVLENNHYILSLGSNDKVDEFFNNGISKLKASGKVQATAAFKRLLGNAKTKFQVSLGIRLGENTLNLQVLGEKLSPEDIQAILNAYQEKRHYFMLKNGQIGNLESPSLEELDRVMSALGVSLKQFVKGKMAVPAYRAFYLNKQLEGRDDLAYTSNDAFQKLIADLENKNIKKFVVPKEVKNVLRPYQKQGFEWLAQLNNYNLGALLADEMGLGKTLQTISLLLSRKEKTKLPNLIIVPASVVYNWDSEIKKFAPELKTLVLGGDKKQRRDQLKKAKKANVLITSYDSLKRDLELYQDLKFDIEVIDEAQNIKNAKSAASKVVKIINSAHRIALTGTPIENNLSELWSIFDYLMPGFLGNYDYFRNNYEKPIVKEDDEKRQKQLSQIVAPFILRRLKKDVLKDLPDKDEEVVYVKMSGKQNQLYQAQTQKLIDKLNSSDDKDFKKQRLQVLAEITKLRELCCDPHLLYEDYRGKSAKLTASIALAQDLISDGHKILLFSQFTSMLAIIKEKLEKQGLKVFEITGSTPKQKRQELIKEFNELGHPAIFLISLKAGGTGINLTSADIVIHYDPWWNIAAENQATDRAHRIGQKNSVQIYKMVAKGTIEEKIIELQEKKEELAEAVLNGEKFNSSVLDREDLLNILER
ncbi:hypothetical protein GCM10022297_07960 [Lactobacillus hamsteri]|uniref:Non-specific serine threonine protein kinase n=1 Tax=Lactobacillus hamsteri DSM 5661 = JCM 6256 TaxID=1423754 RepID=A0A0R1YMR4_9LACO|nr:DEAD/DEAH box helicase [Lactobacillus hamsteri]KRM40515.1 non-specific serine threonine protein kinase [Lactobacillus hamsteri DSM 5661 = JCM 6256]